MAKVKQKRSRGWWYPWIFVGGMTVVILVNAVMITLAVGTFPGIQTQDYYRKGLAYNETLAAAKSQKALGWKIETGINGGVVSATFTDRDGHPIQDLLVEAFLIRPTHEGHDVAVILKTEGNGRYTAPVAVPLPGQWTLRVHAKRGNTVFQDTRKIKIF